MNTNANPVGFEQAVKAIMQMAAVQHPERHDIESAGYARAVERAVAEMAKAGLHTDDGYTWADAVIAEAQTRTGK